MVRPEPKVFLDVHADRNVWWDRCSTTDRTRSMYLVDKSTSYLECDGVPDRILRELPESRVLVVLRNPTERAISNWQFSTDHGYENRPSEIALDPSGAATFTGHHTGSLPAVSVDPHDYVRRGQYAKLLTPWIGRFHGQLDVVIFEELVASAAARDRLTKSLGLHGPGTPPLVPVNASSGTGHVPPSVRAKLDEFYVPYHNDLERLIGRQVNWLSPNQTKC